MTYAHGSVGTVLKRGAPIWGWSGRTWMIVGGHIALLGAIPLIPRIAQNPAYHHFADGRSWLGMANALNVLSNLPFLVVGVLGLAIVSHSRVRSARPAFVDDRERWPYWLFFLGVALTSLGSAYYHLAPGNDRLVWDRLPMTVAFMAFLAAMIAERIGVRLGRAFLFPFLLAGAASVFYWHFTEQMGAGDLRPYALVQFYPLVAILLMMFLRPSRYTNSSGLAVAMGFYVLAKILEVLDIRVFELGGMVSGHTLKHLVAALAPLSILQMLIHREATDDESGKGRSHANAFGRAAITLRRAGISAVALILVAISGFTMWFGVYWITLMIRAISGPYFDSEHWFQDAFLSHGAPGLLFIFALYACTAGVFLNVMGYSLWKRYG